MNIAQVFVAAALILFGYTIGVIVEKNRIIWFLMGKAMHKEKWELIRQHLLTQHEAFFHRWIGN